MSGRLRITADGERYVGLSFLEGRSVSDLAIEQCCSTRAIEAILRAQMRHLIEVKRPALTPTAEDVALHANEGA